MKKGSKSMSFKQAFCIVGMLLSILSKDTLAQGNSEGGERSNYLGIRGSYAEFGRTGTMTAFGPTLHLYVSDRVMLNYHLQFGTDQKGKFHMHSYLGGAGAVLLTVSALGDGSDTRSSLKYIGALVSLFVPEGVGYNVPFSENVLMTPYVNPLGYHIASNSAFSGEAGLRFQFRMGKFNLAPYAGLEVLYAKNIPSGLGFGLELNYDVGD